MPLFTRCSSHVRVHVSAVLASCQATPPTPTTTAEALWTFWMFLLEGGEFSTQLPSSCEAGGQKSPSSVTEASGVGFPRCGWARPCCESGFGQDGTCLLPEEGRTQVPAAQRRAACLQQKRAFNLPTLCLLPLPSTYLTEDTRPIRPAVDAGPPPSTASPPCPARSQRAPG